MWNWFEKHYQSYLALAERRPFSLLAFFVVVSAGLAVYASGIGIRGDLEDLFPEDTPAVQLARETREVLGSTSELRVLIGSPDRELNRAVGARLAAALRARSDDVARVEFFREIEFFEKNALLFLSIAELEDLEARVVTAIGKAVRDDLGLDDFEDEEDEEAPDAAGAEAKEDAERLPSIESLKEKYGLDRFGGYFETPDGTVLAVKAYPTFKPADAPRTRALNAFIEAELAAISADHPQAGLSFAMDGDYSQLTAAVKQITEDATTSALWSLAFITLVVIAWFRRLRAVVAVALVLFVANAWMLAFARVSVGYLNLVTSIIVAILNGLGVDYLIHGMSRVDEEHGEGRGLAEARRIGLVGLARPAFNAMLTTAVTLFALIAFDFRGFSQLGLIAGVGLIMALLAFYLVYPPLSAAMHRLVPQKTPKKARASGHAARPGPRRGLGRGILIAAVPVVAVLGWGALRVHFDPDMGKFRVQDAASENALKKKYKEAESRTASPALIITEDLAETERLHHYMQENLSRWPVLDEVASVFAFVPREQDDKLAIVREVKRRIDNKYGALEGEARADADRLRPYLTPETFGPEALPGWVKERFTDTAGRFGRYVLLYASGSKANAEVAGRIFDQIGAITVPADGDLPEKTFRAAATYFISAEAYNVVRREGPLAAVFALLAVVLVVLVDFRRLRELAMILTPLLAGFVATLGILGFADIPLDLFNIIVLPQVFGIGIDTGTHLAHRLREGGPHLAANMIATAKASGISSLLTVLGFAALIAVQNKGLQSIGWVAVIGVSTTLVFNVVFFFAWYALRRHRAEELAPVAGAVS